MKAVIPGQTKSITTLYQEQLEAGQQSCDKLQLLFSKTTFWMSKFNFIIFQSDWIWTLTKGTKTSFRFYLPGRTNSATNARFILLLIKIGFYRNRRIDIENKFMVTKREVGGVGIRSLG